MKWYRKAADQGVAQSQFNLGIHYHQGKGVPQNDAEAVKWYRKAAEQGNAPAQALLGIAYDSGRGVPQNYVQAHMWLNLAASRSSGKDRDIAVRTREIVASAMNPQQIAEAQKLASEWKPMCQTIARQSG